MTEPGLSGVHATAIGAAMARARHLLLDGEPKVFRDGFALPLTGASAAELAAWTPPGSGGTAVWVLRSRYAEDRLAAARERAIRQYVLLGAGLDSFALRHRGDLGDLIVFEVDDPPMQAWKTRRLAGLGLAPPPNLRFAPCDFERDALAAALAACGFRNDAPAFVSWLGVSHYLTREAVYATLRWAAGLPFGSEGFVMTFVVPSPQALAAKDALAGRGIRIEALYTPQEIEAALRRAGLEHVEALTPERADALYFSGRSDGLRASTQERLVAARRGPPNYGSTGC